MQGFAWVTWKCCTTLYERLEILWLWYLRGILEDHCTIDCPPYACGKIEAQFGSGFKFCILINSCVMVLNKLPHHKASLFLSIIGDNIFSNSGCFGG